MEARGALSEVTAGGLKAVVARVVEAMAEAPVEAVQAVVEMASVGGKEEAP